MPEAAGTGFGANDATVKIGGPPADLLAEAKEIVERSTLKVAKERQFLADAEEALQAAQAVLDSIQGA